MDETRAPVLDPGRKRTKAAISGRLLEEGIGYVIRLPANQVLQRRIGHLLTRPIGRPPKWRASHLRTLGCLWAA
jgi:hypothetical protein